MDITTKLKLMDKIQDLAISIDELKEELHKKWGIDSKHKQDIINEKHQFKEYIIFLLLDGI